MINAAAGSGIVFLYKYVVHKTQFFDPSFLNCVYMSKSAGFNTISSGNVNIEHVCSSSQPARRIKLFSTIRKYSKTGLDTATIFDKI